MAADSNEVISPKKSRGLLLMAIMAIAGVSILALICLGAGLYWVSRQTNPNFQTLSQTITELTIQPVHNQIAFVGNDENIWLVQPDGTQLRQVTQDSQGYRFPTWSPDGRHLAFVGPGGETKNTVLYLSPTAKSDPIIIYDKTDSDPFYLYWSPDSNLISFLTQEKAGLAMRQIAAEMPDADQVMGEGAPFYWVWSPNSQKVFMHVGGSRNMSAKAHLSLLDNQPGAERVELDLAPGRFQAPYWSGDGQYFFYIAEDDQGQEAIYKTQADSLEQTKLTQLNSFAYLTLSPNGQHVAYVELDGNGRPPFGTAHLVDVDGTNEKVLVDSPVGSIYWAPDSSKLALLTLAKRDDGSTAKTGGLAAPLPQEVFFRWLVYDVASESVDALASFVPTTAFLQTVPYFDQYHLSLTFWSPDSRYFVYTNEEDEGTGEGSVWVADSTHQEEGRSIGEGTLAVWSWQ